MPHKRNPITNERISGLARVLRGNAMASIENVALWHERDITHSSVERIILPDSTILLDYMQSLAIKVVRGMTVHTERMLSNLEVTHGALFSQRALLALVDAGLTRDDAYRIVQQGAQQAWDTGTHFRDLLAAEVKAQGIEIDVDAVFDPSAYTKHSREIVARLGDESGTAP
jgi:adenylosuccinate lyase